MGKLWVYNPWNDLALGKDSENYTPPPAALEQLKKGEELMLEAAPAEDFVLVGNTDDYKKNRGAKPWRGEKIDGVVAWGWSRALVTQLTKSGVPRKLMPDDRELDTIRRLSHRRVTVEAHKFLGSQNVPVEALNEAECEEALMRWGRVIGKYPWSSTGRGLFAGETQYRESFLRRCKGAIAHQGSVMIEKAYVIDTDFAMLFYSDGKGDVSFEGYSLFKTNNRAYIGNVPLEDKEIERIITSKTSVETVTQTRESVQEFLRRRVGRLYKGWIGVDMFIYLNEKGELSVNGCVEVNLRMTMGVLNHLILKKVANARVV